MTHAGLYKVGEKHNFTTRCGYCYTTFRDWQSSDVPIREHQRLSPHCPVYGVKKLWHNFLQIKHNHSVTRAEEYKPKPTLNKEIISTAAQANVAGANAIAAAKLALSAAEAASVAAASATEAASVAKLAAEKAFKVSSNALSTATQTPPPCTTPYLEDNWDELDNYNHYDNYDTVSDHGNYGAAYSHDESATLYAGYKNGNEAGGHRRFQGNYAGAVEGHNERDVGTVVADVAEDNMCNLGVCFCKSNLSTLDFI